MNQRRYSLDKAHKVMSSPLLNQDAPFAFSLKQAEKQDSEITSSHVSHSAIEPNSLEATKERDSESDVETPVVENDKMMSYFKYNEIGNIKSILKG